jgi:hypothetical protein
VRIPELDRVIKYAETRPENETVLVLTEALRLIKRGWCRRAMGKFLFIPMPVRFSLAHRFCSVGAMERAARNLGLCEYGAHRALLAVIDRGNIFAWNDKQPWFVGKRNVIRGFERAIAYAS